MAGRIKDTDIKRVRDASAIDDVVGEYVQLRNAGGGNLKGLCPFHDEKSPSFQVSPAKGLFHCFGCGQGGDVIKFVMDLNHIGFTEAVEHLAGRAGIEINYTEGGYTARGDRSQRARLLEAHKLAAAFYAEQLLTPAAAHGRALLDGRGFDRGSVEQFGVGYAPGGWDTLIRYLRSQGVSDDDMLTGGLASQGRRGPIDRFRNRLTWPIADITGDIIGFGARRLDDTEDSPKYLNTPETPIYKKSSVLYGVDRAKRQIAQGNRAVVVEGYTDVMACHLAGVTDAVATCGTSFGEEHVRILRRLLADRNQFLGGRIVFTFDGDAAGRKAAVRAFEEDDARIVGNTYVAVEPTGMDPCELRIAKGDAAVRELIASQMPLVRFVIDAKLGAYDLDNMDNREERTAAMREAIPLVVRLKEDSLVDQYGRYVAKQTGLAESLVLREVNAARRGRRPVPGRRQAVPAPRGQGQTSMPAPIVVDQRDPVGQTEREALKIALRAPGLAGPAFDDLDPDEFTVEPYAQVRRAIAAAGGVTAVTDLAAWPEAVGEHVANEALRILVRELVVEEPKIAREPDENYTRECLTGIRVRSTDRHVGDIKRQLERVNPIKYPEEHTRLFGHLLALEKYRRDLLNRLELG